MAEHKVSTITRTVTVSDLTPAEMASIFSNWFSEDQAAFFGALFTESRNWPALGLDNQLHAIVRDSDADALFVLNALADHVLSNRE